MTEQAISEIEVKKNELVEAIRTQRLRNICDRVKEALCDPDCNEVSMRLLHDESVHARAYFIENGLTVVVDVLHDGWSECVFSLPTN